LSTSSHCVLPPWLASTPSDAAFRCTEYASVLLNEEAASSSQARKHQRILGRPYESMTLSIMPAVETSADKWTTLPDAGMGFDFAYLQGDRFVVAEAKSTVRVASALHDLGKVHQQFQDQIYTPLAPLDQLVQRNGRSNRVGHQMLQMAAGSGKSHVLISLAMRLTQVLRPSASVSVSYSDIGCMAAAIDASLEAEVARSGSGALSWQRTMYVLGRAVGLTRAESRNVRSVLLALVSLRGAVLTRHHDRLNAVGSKGRVYLRTALRGASTRNAPPAFAVVRVLGKTGFQSLPPMSLAA
jgi:hypothetical protein